MESQDGVDELVPLLEPLASDHGLERARLTLVGEGSRRAAAVAAAAAAAGLAERVRFTGLVPHAEVPALLAEADICLDPAPCTELNHRSTMIKVAEYMAAPPPARRLPAAGDAAHRRRRRRVRRREDTASFAAQVAALARDPERRAPAGAGRLRARAIARLGRLRGAAAGRLRGARRPQPTSGAPSLAPG